MSVATSPPAGGDTPAAPPPASPAPPGEACPLCGAPLHPEQEWCLHCGAAARTRLAAAPRWKGLIAALAVVVALSLGVLAAALVKLAGTSGSAPTTTRTITTSAAASLATTSGAAVGSLPGTASTGPSTPRTTATGTTPGATSTATTTTGSTGLTSTTGTGAGKAKAKLRGLGLGRTIEELIHKRKLLPHTGSG